MTIRTELPQYTSRYDVHGYSIVLDVPDREARAAVTAIFQAFILRRDADTDGASQYAITREDPGQWAVWADGAVIYRAAAIADVLVALEWHIVTAVITRRND